MSREPTKHAVLWHALVVSQSRYRRAMWVCFAYVVGPDYRELALACADL